MTARIAFQGELGAYSHQACEETCPDFEPLPCPSFEDALEAVRSGEAELGMIAVENSTYGRVQDVYHLLPKAGLHIVGETFVRVHVNLLGVPGATLADITHAHGHPVILPQCGHFLRDHSIKSMTSTDNARAARDVAAGGDKTQAALASELAAKLYGLDVIAPQIENHKLNTTRFLLMSREADYSRRSDNMVTAFMFRVRNLPAALYKAMGGFATNGVNMTKLESYMVDGIFTATQFYADIEGHPDDEDVKRALDELGYFTEMIEILGVYPADPRRT
jgi:prephenate dehydratase